MKNTKSNPAKLMKRNSRSWWILCAFIVLLFYTVRPLYHLQITHLYLFIHTKTVLYLYRDCVTFIQIFCCLISICIMLYILSVAQILIWYPILPYFYPNIYKLSWIDAGICIPINVFSRFSQHTLICQKACSSYHIHLNRTHQSIVPI